MKTSNKPSDRRLARLCAGLLVGASALFPPSKALAQVEIKDSHIKLNGIGYFRGNAENVQIGSHGDKKAPITSMNYLDVDGTIPRDKLGTVESVLVLTIDATKTSKTDLFGKLSDVSEVFGVSADAAWEKVKSQKLKLVKFVFNNGQIKKAANQSQKVLESLKDRGKGARIANQVFVVMTAEMAETFSRSTSIDASATDGKVKLTAKGGTSSSGNAQYTLSKGSTFAYGLVKIDWDKGKDKIDSLEDDHWSFN